MEERVEQRMVQELGIEPPGTSKPLVSSSGAQLFVNIFWLLYLYFLAIYYENNTPDPHANS